jgi:Uncharacterized protein conserved in bacteria (DUF2188)
VVSGATRGYAIAMALKVVENTLDGWDVMREDEDTALSNHPTRQQAEEAAKIRAEEERVGDEGDEPVEVSRDEVHGIDDTRVGVKPAFLSFGGLLIAVTLLAAAIAIVAAVTGFGS